MLSSAINVPVNEERVGGESGNRVSLSYAGLNGSRNNQLYEFKIVIFFSFRMQNGGRWSLFKQPNSRKAAGQGKFPTRP